MQCYIGHWIDFSVTLWQFEKLTLHFAKRDMQIARYLQILHKNNHLTYCFY